MVSSFAMYKYIQELYNLHKLLTKKTTCISLENKLRPYRTTALVFESAPLYRRKKTAAKNALSPSCFTFTIMLYYSLHLISLQQLPLFLIRKTYSICFYH